MSPFVPMLSITGNPTKEELENHLGNFLKNGIDQFMIYARTGLGVEYMSEDWYKICRYCIDFARENKMKVWLYDEYNWPSGSCQNRVAHMNDGYIASRFVYNNGVVSVVKMDIDEANMALEPFSVDVLNEDAIKCFIKLTHEQYYEWFGDDFGTTIVGVYSDEPSFHYSVSADNQLPYYSGIETDYSIACGRNIFDDLRGFFEGKPSQEFMLNYCELLSDKFHKTFFKTIGEWCDKHNIIFTGHLVADDSVCGTVNATGNPFLCLSEMQMPGCDDIFSSIEAKTDLVYSQMEYIKNKTGRSTMAELFALGECSMSFSKMKQILWYAAIYGIDNYFILSLFDARANFIKDNYFFSFTPDMPNFCGVSELIKTAEQAKEYANKKPFAEIAVRYPLYEAYKNFDDKSGEIDNKLYSLTDSLIIKQLPWKMIAHDDLSDCKITVSIIDGKYVIEEDNSEFEKIDDCIEAILRDYKYKIYVTENGQLADNIHLKQYEDGSFVVLDRNNAVCEDRNLVINYAGICKNFVLNGFGIYTDKSDLSNWETVDTITNFTISKSNVNLIRPKFIDGISEVTFENDSEIFFNIRNHPEKCIVYLDDELISTPYETDNLTGCFNRLYSKSEKIIVKKGLHKLICKEPDKDFLPITVIETKNTDNGFYDKLFVDFTLKLDDADKYAIKCDNSLLVSQMYIDGKLIDTTAFAPFIHKIPAAYNGKSVSVRLVFYSSFAPIFGTVTDPKISWGRRISNPESLEVKNFILIKSSDL